MCPELVLASADLETWKHFTRWPTWGSRFVCPPSNPNLGPFGHQGRQEPLDVLLPAQGLLVVEGLGVERCKGRVRGGGEPATIWLELAMLGIHRQSHKVPAVTKQVHSRPTRSTLSPIGPHNCG